VEKWITASPGGACYTAGGAARRRGTSTSLPDGQPTPPNPRLSISSGTSIDVLPIERDESVRVNSPTTPPPETIHQGNSAPCGLHKAAGVQSERDVYAGRRTCAVGG